MKLITISKAIAFTLISNTIAHTHHFHEADDEQLSSKFKLFSERTVFPLTRQLKVEGVSKNTLFLTIDDGPTPRVTNNILDSLRQYDVRATFFVVGNKVSIYKSIMNRIQREGHTIGNHSFHHETNFTSINHFYNSLIKTHKAISPYTGNNKIMLVRTPGGVWNEWRKSIGNKHTVLRDYVGPVYWNVGGGSNGVKNDADWKCWKYKQSVKSCARSYIRQIYRQRERGTASIVLFHDINIKSAKLIKEVLRQLSNDNINWKFKMIEDIPSIKKMNK